MPWNDYVDPLVDNWDPGDFVPAADLNGFLQQNTLHLKRFISLGPVGAALTITADTITITKSYHVIDDTGTVETILIEPDGDEEEGRLLIVRVAAGEAVTFNELGNIVLGDLADEYGDVVLDPDQYLVFFRGPSNWHLFLRVG